MRKARALRRALKLLEEGSSKRAPFKRAEGKLAEESWRVPFILEGKRSLQPEGCGGRRGGGVGSKKPRKARSPSEKY